ncbi:MAG: precorrin-6A reductase [Firmicutes bacterium]|nr:precorrin-6A reductase [Bacillota bacterium]
MMLLFGGTSEARLLAGHLSERGIETLLFVATDYGKEVLDEMPFVKIVEGRLSAEEMAGFMPSADLVIDATHPYAAEVTKNIRLACEKTGKKYLRLLRPETACDGTKTADSVEAAVKMLENTSGNIFISTGSKELEKYRTLDKNRLCVRVLPTDEARQKCAALGMENVIYAKGPFDLDTNLRHFGGCGAKWLVTKSSGSAGGFDEKIKAAKQLGMEIVVIKRPDAETGYDLEQAVRYIDEFYIKTRRDRKTQF